MKTSLQEGAKLTFGFLLLSKNKSGDGRGSPHHAIHLFCISGRCPARYGISVPRYGTWFRHYTPMSSTMIIIIIYKASRSLHLFNTQDAKNNKNLQNPFRNPIHGAEMYEKFLYVTTPMRHTNDVLVIRRNALTTSRLRYSRITTTSRGYFARRPPYDVLL